MPNDQQLQNSFTSGEISQRLRGRVDTAEYKNALKECLNMVVLPEGGLTRRGGSRYVAEVKTSADSGRIIPFRFSNIQNYVLEFGDLYFRIYRNRAQVISGTPVEVVTPWSDDKLVDLKFTQSADVLYVCHPTIKTRKITRTSDTSWTVSEFENRDGPYLPINTTTTTLTPSGLSGSITVTASAGVFASTDVGRLIRIKESGTWGWLKITAYASATSVTATVMGANLAASSAVTDWRLGAWSDTTGWPQVCCFYEERLFFGATTANPQTVWGSASADFENFQPSNASGTIADSDGVTFTIADDQVNNIRWMVPATKLLVGTAEGEHTFFGGSTTGSAPITPSNITVRRQSSYGSVSNVRALMLEDKIFYAQPSRRKIRSARYDFNSDSYVSANATFISRDITKSGVIDFDRQKEPYPIGWFPRTDGALIGVTNEGDVSGWHKHVFGGTGVYVESVAVIPNPSGTSDDLWLLVRRTINGSTKRYIEWIGDEFDPDSNGQYSAFFVDSGLTYDGYLDAGLTLSSASVGTGRTATASSSVFDSGMVGRKIKAGNGVATITAYSSGTSVTVEITVAFSGTTFTSGYWSVARQSFTGAGHLEAETCSVCVDGASHPDVTISSGGFTLDDFYSYVSVGLGYVSRIATMPTESPQFGTTQGRKKRIKELDIYFYQTLGAKFGRSPAILETLPFRTTGAAMNMPPPLFTGYKVVSFPAGYDLEPVVYIVQEQPLPMSILFIKQNQYVSA